MTHSRPTDLLDDERMTRMRSSVMSAVDADTQRRGRSMRRRLGVAGAAASIAVIGAVGVSLVDPGGLSTPAGSESSADTVSDSAALAEPGPSSLDAGSARDQSAEVAPVDALPREVVVTGTAQVTAEEPADVSRRLASWVEGRGGRVDSRSITDGGDSDAATLTVRVPAAQVTATLDHLDTYGQVTGVSVTNDDVTGAARDLDARIKALNISIDRLERILGDADSSAEVVNAEQALTQRQEQLEQLTSQRQQISEQVALATLTIAVSPTEPTSSVDPGGFSGGLRDGWSSLVDVVNRVVELTGTVLPWLGVVLVGYAGLHLVRRVRRR